MSDTLQRAYEDVYLWQADDRARLTELQEDLSGALTRAEAATEVADAEDAEPRTIGEGTPGQQAAAEAKEDARAASRVLDAFITEAKGRARVVRMVALKRSAWRTMRDRHPPRMVTKVEKADDGTETASEVPHEVDDVRGFNVESIADELVPESVGPDEFANTTTRDEFLDNLSEPDFDALYVAALRVNVGGFAAPKAEYSSRVDRIIDATSSSPDDSD